MFVYGQRHGSSNHVAVREETLQRVLGHRNIQNTLLYINIENVIYQNSDGDQFHVKVAHDADEAKNLLETGFNYVGEIHGAQMFRKRR